MGNERLSFITFRLYYLLLSCKPLSCEKGSDFVFENRSPDCDTLHVVTGI
jgi:hypothetical protein